MNENEKRILVVSFGTSFKDRRENSIGGIERAVQTAFPEYTVQRCFTSGMVIRHIERDEGEKILNPQEALEKAAGDGVKELIILPTHVMNGLELQKFRAVLENYEERFEKVVMCGPLLDTAEDNGRVIAAVRRITQEFDDANTGIVLIGHGTSDDANVIYAQIQQELKQIGCDRYFVGTIEASPSYEDVKNAADKAGVSRLVLLPFMVVAGDHAINDLAGEEEDSWKSKLEKNGYEVLVLQKGLGEYEEVQKLYVKHVREAIRDSAGN